MSDLSKLKWHCRRGMKELDVLLTCYLEQHYKQAPAVEQQTFEALLELSDKDLYTYLIEFESPKDERMQVFVEKMRRIYLNEEN